MTCPDKRQSLCIPVPSCVIVQSGPCYRGAYLHNAGVPGIHTNERERELNRPRVLCKAVPMGNFVNNRKRKKCGFDVGLRKRRTKKLLFSWGGVNAMGRVLCFLLLLYSSSSLLVVLPWLDQRDQRRDAGFVLLSSPSSALDRV